MKREIVILLLEDNPNDVELMRLSLKASGLPFQLRHVTSGRDFPAVLQSSKPDIIISDYSLPAYDGKSALVAAQVLCPDTPFIFYSGTIGEEAAIDSLKLGATDYVLKDKPKRLISAIHRAIEDAEQRRAQRASVDEIRAQAQLLDLATDAITVRDTANNVVFWNSGAESLYGFTRDEAVGKNDLITPASPTLYEEARRSTLGTGNWKGELEYILGDGKIMVVMSRWTLVRTQHGEPHRILFIETDITEKKRRDATFLRRQRLESVGTLASGIAHDLNNILTPILMSYDAIKDVQPTSETAEMIRLIGQSAERGAELVKQLVTFVWGGDGKRTSVDLKLLIKDVISLVRNTFPKNIHTAYAVVPDLHSVHADPTQIHQVLLNLCINAKDAMPQGGKLCVSAKNLSTERVIVEVVDTGTGIPVEILDKIFDPFFTTKEVGKGTGLGLSMAMGITKSHGGDLSVESGPGAGTTFKLCLPAERVVG